MVRRSSVYCTCRWNVSQHAVKPDIGSESRYVDSTLMAYELGNMTVTTVSECIELSYITLVSVLQTAANNFVPKCQKGFFKFWWDEELNPCCTHAS